MVGNVALCVGRLLLGAVFSSISLLCMALVSALPSFSFLNPIPARGCWTRSLPVIHQLLDAWAFGMDAAMNMCVQTFM